MTTWRRFGSAVVAMPVLVFCTSGCGQFLGPKATLGPGAIVRGRSLYNDVISATNNEQTLESIVRARYGEPLGLLSVASVTANLRATATSEAQVGFGAPSNYKGNIVPLSVGVAYEENPTISYTPVQGERYAKSVLTPIGLDVLVLLLGIEHSPTALVSILVKHINGVQNPMYGPPEARAAFRASIAELGHLADAGLATWTAIDASSFALVIHDYVPGHSDEVRRLLRSWGVSDAAASRGGKIVLPLRLAFGPTTEPALNVQTRSVYDLIEIAARSVEVPTEHAERGLANQVPESESPLRGVFTIHSSQARPSGEVLVATRHHGYWFYVAANDGPSKFVFRLLQTLIGMRLVDAAPQGVPTLTIPIR